MKYLFFILCLFPLFAHAGLILSIGPSGVSGIESKAENSAGKKFYDGDGTLGYNVGVEFPMLRNYLSFKIDFFYARMYGKSQYQDRVTGLQISDQKSFLSNTDGLIGLKIRPVNMKYLKLFVGAGGVIGTMKLRHDKEDYEERFGTPPSNFKEIEKAQNWGHYFEAGTEIIFTKKSGIRLGGQLVNKSSERFATLNKKSINGSYANISLQYIHYFEKIFPK